MRKVRLDLQALQVETFQVEADAYRAAGTVRGHEPAVTDKLPASPAT